MNQIRRTIARNASVLMASQLITWVLALLLTVVLPRYLGASSIGKYSLATSLLAIIGIVSSFGMETLIKKEVARSPQRYLDLFGTVAVLRFCLYLLGYLVLAAYVKLVGYPVDTIQVVAILCVSTLIDQFANIQQASLMGMERMEYVSLTTVVNKIFTTVVSIVLLLLGQGLLAIAAVTIGASLINLGISSLALRRLQKGPSSFDLHLVRWILKSSFPYLMSTVFLILYQRVDTVIISLLTNEKEIGWYSAADTLYASLLFVPTIFMTAVFPTLVRLYVSGADVAQKVVRKSFDLLLIVGIPIGLGVVAVADPVVVLLYGADFAGSGPILAVFGVVLILTYLNILLGQYMISIDRQSVWTVIMAIATVLTIPLDLVFMPFCQKMYGNSAIGGALSFVVTELGMVIAGLIFMPRGVLKWSNALLFGKTLLAGLVMTAIVWQVRDQFFVVPLVIGAAVYTVSILILRVLSKEDWQVLTEMVQQLVARFNKKALPTTVRGE